MLNWCLFFSLPPPPPDPTFISSAYMPAEEKVYFFFSEMGCEYDFIDKFTVSRVAQVCTVRHFLCALAWNKSIPYMF